MTVFSNHPDRFVALIQHEEIRCIFLGGQRKQEKDKDGKLTDIGENVFQTWFHRVCVFDRERCATTAAGRVGFSPLR